ncbi:hypothetical protein F5X68DRAFT_211698 [Plectosphaerella plurivora]|uniref:NACHT-NTPase and P-loop NTPases N-terminal domain-containing protein n=1 Tax=Plectosphaerella plurivora TaxID=936078 RepID=A0A9P8V711_9PEZI|nr:hypothetical protein F5X68DRAFT_211698 [Plectosphaerella plurivora]
MANPFSDTIQTLQAATRHYNDVQNDKGLQESFHESGRGLELVAEALQIANAQLARRDMTGDLQGTMKEFNVKAKITESIYQAVAQSPGTSKFQPYKDAVGQMGQGRMVEVLVTGMMKDVCAMAQNDAIKTEMEGQVNRLQDAIKKLSTMEPSLPAESGGTFTHHGSGDQINAPGGTQRISKGSGPQFHETNFHAPITFGQNPS